MRLRREIVHEMPDYVAGGVVSFGATLWVCSTLWILHLHRVAILEIS